MNNNKKSKFLLLITGILIIIFVYNYNIKIPCIFFELTHLYCPGCGITRALKSIIKLDFYQAFRYNMLVTLLSPIFLLYILNKYFSKQKKKIPNFIWYLILFITILFGVLRNIPAFNFLAPTII